MWKGHAYKGIYVIYGNVFQKKNHISFMNPLQNTHQILHCISIAVILLGLNVKVWIFLELYQS